MKFRVNDQITISFTNNNYQIIVGPIVNRSKLLYEYYQLFLDSNFQSIISPDLCEKNFIHNKPIYEQYQLNQIQDQVKKLPHNKDPDPDPDPDQDKDKHKDKNKDQDQDQIQSQDKNPDPDPDQRQSQHKVQEQEQEQDQDIEKNKQLNEEKIQSTHQVHDYCKDQLRDDLKITTYKTIYKKFRNLFEIDHATKMNENTIPMTNQNLLDDLDFMNNEIIKCKIAMNNFYQNSDMTKYNAYRQMIYTDTHKMFELESPEEYNNYLDHISKLIPDYNIDDTKKEFDNMRDVSENLWNDHKTDDLDSEVDDEGSDDKSSDNDDQYSDNKGSDDDSFNDSFNDKGYEDHESLDHGSNDIESIDFISSIKNKEIIEKDND